MCFSANASFGAGIVLTVIGIAAIRKTQHPSQIPFACIPLLFALQQIAEGILWKILPNGGDTSLQLLATNIYIIFAQIFWPLWVPVAILLVEKHATRRKYQKILVGVGMIVSMYFFYCFLFYNVRAKIEGHHISYLQDYPATLNYYAGAFYIIATVAPPFFSHIKKMWLLGLTIVISYIISQIFYEHYIVSVWCFFASIISISVYIIILELKNAQAKVVNFSDPKSVVIS